MSTETLTEQHYETIATKEHHLVLFNDDVNTFDYVIELLVNICNLDVLQAEQCAYLVHYKGKCSVKEGSYEKLKPLSELLADGGLTVEIN